MLVCLFSFFFSFSFFTLTLLSCSCRVITGNHHTQSPTTHQPAHSHFRAGLIITTHHQSLTTATDQHHITQSINTQPADLPHQPSQHMHQLTNLPHQQADQVSSGNYSNSTPLMQSKSGSPTMGLLSFIIQDYEVSNCYTIATMHSYSSNYQYCLCSMQLARSGNHDHTREGLLDHTVGSKPKIGKDHKPSACDELNRTLNTTTNLASRSQCSRPPSAAAHPCHSHNARQPH